MLRITLAAIDIGVQLEPRRGGGRGRGAFTSKRYLSLAATALQHSALRAPLLTHAATTSFH